MMFSAISISGLALLASSAVTAFAPSIGQPRLKTDLFAGVERNGNFAKLAGGYLFPEIGRRRNAYLEEHPEMADKIISLGIGDTTRPIPPHILGGLMEGVKKLGNEESYIGTSVVQHAR